MTVRLKNILIFLHLSIYLGFLIPAIGFLVPVLIWRFLHKQNDLIDEQGRAIVNWILSFILFSILGLVLILFDQTVAGTYYLIILSLALITPIMGLFKAIKEQIWIYPLSFKFF